jgi:hypothetical protein
MAEHERCACGAVPELWGPPVCRWVRCPQCRWSGPNSDSAEDAWASWDSVMRAVREARDNAEEFTRLYAGPHERAAHAETKRLLREVTKDTCWHCGAVLEPVQHPNCTDCPPYAEGCDGTFTLPDCPVKGKATDDE